MKPKTIEFILSILLLILLIYSLINNDWTTLFMFIICFALIINYIYGFLKRKTFGTDAYTTFDLFERGLIMIFIIGVVLNVSHINNSVVFISFGLFFLFLFYLIKSIYQFRKNEVVSGIELLFVSLICTGFLFVIKHWPGGNILLIFNLSFLSLLYFSASFVFMHKYFKLKQYKTGVFGMIAFWSLSLFVYSILYHKLYWPGAILFFWSGLIISFTGISFFTYFTFNLSEIINKQKLEFNNLYKRLLIISGISIFLVVATPQQIIRLEYGNRPHIIEASYNYIFSYDLDEELKKEYNKELHILVNLFNKGYYEENISESKLDSLKEEFMELYKPEWGEFY